MPGETRVRSYRDLRVWQKAMALVVESYRVAKLLPKSETYGLIGQIQRAAVSIPANIAEGHGREHLGDYVRHLSVANGSLMELGNAFLDFCRIGLLNARPDRAGHGDGVRGGPHAERADAEAAWPSDT